MGSMTNNAFDRIMLSEARKLNSDLGRHVKHSSFSTHLTGRFYQNNSLESHNARAHRIAQMTAKRKQLERSLVMEEKKILFLESKLKERQLQRLEEEEMRVRVEKAAIVIQSQVRRVLSVEKVEVKRIESEIMYYVVQFIQSLYRGRRDRRRVHNLRMKIIRHRKEELSAIQIQSSIRQYMAKIELGRKVEERMVQHNKAACFIQAHIRGYQDRNHVTSLIQQRSAIKIQSCYRGMVGRHIRDARVKARKKEREKAQRIPLHERRYSTYSVESSARKDSITRRRFTEIVSSMKKTPTSTTEKRLSGIEMLRLVHNKNRQRNNKTEQKENTEVDINSSTSHNDNKESSSSDCTKHNDVIVDDIVVVDDIAAVTVTREDKKEERLRSVSISSNKDEEKEQYDKILLSRQRAAARAAKLKRQSLYKKKEELQYVKNRKKELDKLELKRREKMKMKQRAVVAKKEKERKDVKLLENSGNADDEHSSIKMSKKKESKGERHDIIINDSEEVKVNNDTVVKVKNEPKSQMIDKKDMCNNRIVVLDNINFDDDNFEEEFDESEFDLDDI